MAPLNSYQNGNNEPAPPRQDQTDLAPTPEIEYPEHVEQLMEQGVSIAIMNTSSPILTSSERAAFQEQTCLAWIEPLPDDDDFADEPLPTLYDPKTSIRYDWTKPAWIQEKDNEGRTRWRSQIGRFVRYDQPEGVPDQDENRSTAERHEDPEPRNSGSEGVVRK